MSTAAAFLECDPPDECPSTDTHTTSAGGQKVDDSNGKVNNTNIVEKVKSEVKFTGDTSDFKSVKIAKNSFAPKLKKKFKIPNISPAL